MQAGELFASRVDQIKRLHLELNGHIQSIRERLFGGAKLTQLPTFSRVQASQQAASRRQDIGITIGRTGKAAAAPASNNSNSYVLSQWQHAVRVVDIPAEQSNYIQYLPKYLLGDRLLLDLNEPLAEL